ncbi:MAG: ABC transporter ATP-binding protein [Lachnospiraceae bacterium]|nr:ABC transporter ATP-binding protein [uncultured Acetatifactor sp.]MCI9218166.1 ABC transporter ATP-binding protein [Lachnospiraceae bacterium]
MSYKADETAIRVSNVTKAYKIFDTPGQRFLYHMFHTNKGRDFIALDDVSFEVKKGEAFGIIGRNGSGKSTMLQILAGIIKKTSGEIEVHGRIAALLELGSGFNPESTGYENIYMNAAILGVSKEDIDAKVDQIIAFADIGDFINQPVKTYSSGMFVRLAFAVAINVDADIILIDEALAVGDVFFRQKCYSRLNQLKEEGKTIILVSHGMNEVEQFCDRAILLNKGKAVELGDSREVVKKYYILDVKSERYIEDSEKELEERELYTEDKYNKFEGWELRDELFYDLNHRTEIGNEKTHIVKVGIFDEDGCAKRVFTQGEWAYFFIEVEVKQDIEVPLSGITLYDHRNIIVHGKDNLQLYCEVPHTVERQSRLFFLQKMKLDLGIGDYTFDIGIATMKYADYQKRSYRTQEEVNETMERLATIAQVGSFSIHTKPVGEPMQLMFHGCADLAGDVQIKVKR